MKGLAALSLLMMGIVTLALGARLALTWWRTGKAPELYFAIAFLTGSIGSAGGQIGQRFLWTEPGSLASAMNSSCFALVAVGTAMLYIAVWQIFGEGRHATLTGFVLVGSACMWCAFYPPAFMRAWWSGAADPAV